jgi:hypothetical protein
VSSDYLGNLSLSSFSGNPSRSSSFSSPGSEDSGSSSSDVDTPCSAIFDSLDTSACGSCQLQSRDPTCIIKNWKDLSSRTTSPDHETTPSFPNRNSESRLKQLRKELQKSPSSTSSSNNEEITCTKNRMDISLSLSENSDASVSLPSPITCTSMEISTASLLTTSAAAQYHPPSSPHAEVTDISFKRKAKVYSVEKNERKPEADSQDPFCSESKEGNIILCFRKPSLPPIWSNLLYLHGLLHGGKTFLLIFYLNQISLRISFHNTSFTNCNTLILHVDNRVRLLSLLQWKRK